MNAVYSFFVEANILKFVLECFVMSFVTICFITFWLYQLSRRGQPINRHFVTECPLKSGMIVTRGSKPTKVITGGKLTYNNEFVLVDENGKTIELDEETGAIKNVNRFLNNRKANTLGINWIGIPYIDRISMLHFDWDRIVQTEKKQDSIYSQIESQHKDTEYFSLIKSVAILLTSLEVGHNKYLISEREDSDRVKSKLLIDILLSPTFIIVDVMKAICLTNWLQGASGLFAQTSLKYCGGLSIDEIIDDSGEGLVKKLMLLNGELLSKFGVVIYQISYRGYDYTGNNREEIMEATQRVYIAQQDALAKNEATDAEERRIRLLGIAEADTKKLLCNAWQGQGMIALSHAIEKSTGLKTVVLGGNAGINITTDEPLRKEGEKRERTETREEGGKK